VSLSALSAAVSVSALDIDSAEMIHHRKAATIKGSRRQWQAGRPIFIVSLRQTKHAKKSFRELNTVQRCSADDRVYNHIVALPMATLYTDPVY